MAWNYPEGTMRGSGIYSSDEDVTIDPCAECGTIEGTEWTDDWGRRSITCEHGHQQPEPVDDRDGDVDADWGADDWLDARWDDFRDGAADPDW